MQAVIFDPGRGTIETYNPLVVDQGTAPAAPLVSPMLPKGATVAIFGGGNDDVTELVGPGKPSCIGGAHGKDFGQVFFCGAAHFFTVSNNSDLAIPALGTDTLGNPCPSVRSFALVDQDQSDNVQTTYLAVAGGQTAQDTVTNRKALRNATTLVNGSDNTLLAYVDRAIGCVPWLVPDTTNEGMLVPTQATDELQAARYQNAPVALVPAGDPMVGPNNMALLNAFRIGVDQPLVDSLDQASTATYCTHLMDTQLGFINAHRAALLATIFPPAGMALYPFMLARYQASLKILGCPGAGV